MKTLKRFEDMTGRTWDEVIETGLGDPSETESRAIIGLGYYGQEITPKTIRGLAAGKPFSQVERKSFVFRIFAPDGTHTHRFGSKSRLIADARRYGPAAYPRGDRAWSDDDGYRYELEGATLAEVFPPDAVPAPPPLPPMDAEPNVDALYERHLDDQASKNVDPREEGWL